MTHRMRKPVLGSASLLAATISMVLAMQAAEAQDTPEIVVTGSRIKREGTFDAPVPLVTVDTNALAKSGITMVGDVLAALPQTLAGVGPQNTSGTLFNAGQARVDLRGLGSVRTLVLMDGRRNLTGDFRTSSVDLNMMPSTMIERIDVISGGASAVYGSEAIAGVVNVILRKELDGFVTDLQAGISNESDGEEWKASAGYGMRFAEGRGSFVVGIEAGALNAIFQKDRDWAYPGVRRDNTVSPQTIVPNSRSNLSPIATFQLLAPNATARSASIALDRSTVNVNSAACRTTTPSPFCQDPWLIYTASYNALQGDVDRRALRGYLDFEITDGIKAFVDASYAQVDGFSYSSSAFSNTTNTGQMPVVIRGDNAYLNGSSPLAAQLRTQWTGAGLTLVRNTTVQVGKLWDEFGNRNSDITRESYRAITGLEGSLDLLERDIDWEVYAQHSRLRGVTIGFNTPNIGRVQQATDAVLLGGQIVCNDAAARAAGCQPWDLINGPSPEAVAWTNANARADGVASQTVFAANANTSIFDLPAGPIGMALGGEYRQEKSDQIQDPLSAAGLLFYNQIGRTQGAYHIREGYLEIAVPLLKELPGAHRLSVEAAGRYGDYSSVGGVKQWRLQTTWAPIEDVSVRASKSVAVRAPNITELFAPVFRNFTTTANDPCDRAQVAGIASDPARQAIRIANCTASIPGYSANPTTGFVSNIGSGRPSLALNQGGFPGLSEETAETETLGVVFRPTFLADFQLSLDYWKIEIEDAVNTIPINTLLANLCYDAPVAPASNRFCQFVHRDSTGAILDVTLINQNLQSIKTSGYDLAVQYAREFGAVGTFALRIDTTKITRWDLEGFPGAPITHYAGKLTGVNGAVPDYKANAALGWTRNVLSLQWQTRMQSSYGVSEIDPPSSRDPFYTGNYYEHDLRGGYQVNEDLAVRLGIINVTDEHPPLLPEVAGAINAQTSTYDNRGRWFYAGVNYQFGKSR